MALNRKRFVLFLRHNFAFYCGCNCRKENFDDACALQLTHNLTNTSDVAAFVRYHQYNTNVWKGKIRFIGKFQALHSTC